MNLSTFRISTRLLALTLLSSLFTLFVGLMGLLKAGDMATLTADMYNNNLVPIADAGDANMQAVYHNRALYAVAVESDKVAMSKLAEDLKRYEADTKKLLEKYSKSVLRPEETETLKKFDTAWAAYLKLANEVLSAAYSDRSQEAMAMMNGDVKKTFQVADDLLSELVKINLAAGKSADEASDATAAQVRNVGVALILIAVALSVGLGWKISASIVAPLKHAMNSMDRIAEGDLATTIEHRGNDEVAQLQIAMEGMRERLRSIVANVRDTSDSVATGSAEIAQGNADLSQRTEEQASALEETAATMDELGSTVRNNADNAQQANQLAINASQVAEHGGAVVSQVVETMRGINDSSKRISDIIAVIDGIAFQTNILALNAAVEAARAGEQGRGFAVVASEVRSLAQRSADAAKEIKTLISTSVERVEHGSTLVDSAGQTMGEIVGAIKRVTDIVAEISAASREQSAGVSQVGEAITQMDKVTQQNAALVEESAAAAESLKQQADQLVQAMAFFKTSSHG